MGLIELANENYAKAIEFFQKQILLDPYFFKSNLNSLALAYYESGNLEKAKSEYETIISYPTTIREYEDEFVMSFYMLGKIYEKEDNTAKAIEHYEKFLTLWKDADPGIAEVDDARERLAGLKGQ
jgi:tetratricopeptide (TPR) repeat protein